MSTATETIEEFVNQEYKYGFTTNVETETIPPGLNEDVVRLISLKKSEPQVPARMAAQGLPPLAHHEGADLAACPLFAH